MGASGGTLSFPEDVNILHSFKKALTYCGQEGIEEFLPLFTSKSRDPKKYFIHVGVMGAVYNACYDKASKSEESEFLDRECYRAQRFLNRISRE